MENDFPLKTIFKKNTPVNSFLCFLTRKVHKKQNGSGEERMDGREKKKCMRLRRKMWHSFFAQGKYFPPLGKKIPPLTME